ncbi:MAG: hypothetical protein AAF628_18055 [Planctomycetota bacterium]
MKLSLLALAISWPFAAISAQTVLVVDDDGGPGAEFTEVQAAIDAAAPGDTILVKGGTYNAATIDAISLQLVADRGAAVLLQGVVVRNLAPTDTVVIHGFTINGLGPSLDVRQSAGVLWLEDSTIVGPDVLIAHGLSSVGVSLSNAGKVVIARCGIFAGLGPSGVPGSPGLSLATTELQMFGSTVVGGHQQAAGMEDGGPGLFVGSATVHAQGCAITGGNGADAFQSILCFSAGDGGPGALTSGTSTLELLDTTVAGGDGGAPTPSCPAGATGPATEVRGGAVVQTPGAAHRLSADLPVREGKTLTFDLSGPPGDAAALFVTPTAAPQAAAPLVGPLLGDLATLVALPVGAFPASGTLQVSFTVPTFPAGFDALGLFAQIVGADTLGRVTGGSGQHVTGLSAVF